MILARRSSVNRRCPSIIQRCRAPLSRDFHRFNLGAAVALTPFLLVFEFWWFCSHEPTEGLHGVCRTWGERGLPVCLDAIHQCLSVDKNYNFQYFSLICFSSPADPWRYILWTFFRFPCKSCAFLSSFFSLYASIFTFAIDIPSKSLIPSLAVSNVLLNLFSLLLIF